MTDDTTRRDLPEAFAANEPSADQEPGQFGAGHLVGSAVPESTRNERRDESASDADIETKVDEASEESFPGSDPPSFGHTSST